MTRLRFFELPMEHDGDKVSTPFVLVFDRCSDPRVMELVAEDLKAGTGAKAVLAFPEEVDFE